MPKYKIKYSPSNVGLQVNVEYGTRNLTVKDDNQSTEYVTGSVVQLKIEIKHN